MLFNASPPETATPVLLFPTVPFPSTPWPPRSDVRPPGVRPHLYELSPPPGMKEKVGPPGTAVGAGNRAVVPLPSGPSLPAPQQYAFPPTVTPHVDDPPAFICANTPV